MLLAEQDRVIGEQENPLTVSDRNATLHIKYSQLVADIILFVPFTSVLQNLSVPWKVLTAEDYFICQGPGIFIHMPILTILVAVICGSILCIEMIKCLKKSTTTNKNERTIGKLTLSTNDEVAYGANGTIVFGGTYMGRKVAVKRMLRSFYHIASKEIDLLIKSDSHPNIVRYFGVESDTDFDYLILERCDCNLDDIVNMQLPKNASIPRIVINLKRKNGFAKPSLLRILRDIVSGVEHMHKEGIIHRDLKPQNILIRNVNPVCAKISDLGISKILAPSTSSLTLPVTGSGTFGWEAPETIRGERQTRGVDLFSMGCIIFYSLTLGYHPFGEEADRTFNIRNNKMVNKRKLSYPEAYDLVCHLLDPVCDVRPKASDVLLHPFFWDSEKRLIFIRDASDRLKLKRKLKSNSILLQDLESKFASVVSQQTWDMQIDACYISHMTCFRRYNYQSLQELLRFIRNSYNHFQDLPASLQGLLKSPRKGLDDYFIIQFPELFMHVYGVIRKYCSKEQTFCKYF